MAENSTRPVNPQPKDAPVNDTTDTTDTTLNDTLATGTARSATDARPVRAGTVVWGVIMVAIAAMFFATAQLDLGEVSGWVILAWGVLALGAILVVGGLIAALTRRP